MLPSKSGEWTITSSTNWTSSSGVFGLSFVDLACLESWTTLKNKHFLIKCERESGTRNLGCVKFDCMHLHKKIVMDDPHYKIQDYLECCHLRFLKHNTIQNTKKKKGVNIQKNILEPQEKKSQGKSFFYEFL